MDEEIFEDLEKLFEQCDSLTKSFNDSIASDCTVIHKRDDNRLKNKLISSCVKETDIAESDARKQSTKHNRKILQRDERTEDHTDSEQSRQEEGECNKTYVERDSLPVLEGKNEKSKKEKAESENKYSSSAETVQRDKKTEDHSDSEQSSQEEGECTRTFVETDSIQAHEEKKGKSKKEKEMIENNYSSFIDSSKEEGECSTTSFEEDDLETTIKEVSPEKANELLTEANKENMLFLISKKNKEDLKRDFTRCKNLKKRKRSISECNENTPKRRHLFISEDVLSPIGCVSAEKQSNILETAETPLIESKFNFQAEDVCSSTPVTTSQKFIFPSDENCSTPVSATNTAKQSNLVKKEILKTEDFSDSDSEFKGFSDVEEITDNYQTVDELIAEITQLCEEDVETAESESSDTEEVKTKSDTVSKIEVSELISEWKSRSSCESTTDTEASRDGDKTITGTVELSNQNEETDTLGSDIENLTVISAVGTAKKEKGNGKDESLSDDKGGRFKAEVTVSRIEEEKGNETNTEVVDMDICDGNDEQQYGADLLNLNDYDDEGFVDENVLESSHLTKDLNLTMKSKETIESNNNDVAKGKSTGEQKDSIFNLVQSLKKKTEKQINSSEKTKKDINENIVKGLNYAAFDTSIYRKNENTAIEREICRRWRTKGSADPDVNLTVATTKRNRYMETGGEPVAGFLEGEQVVCTYLYEEEIVSQFKYYGKTDGQSDLCYMTLENLLRKLYNQKLILESMNKQSLLNIKQEIHLQLRGTKERHREEMEVLKYRQAMEDEHFRFNSRNQFNVVLFQCRLMQLRQDHIFQQNRLREHHHNEFCAVQSRGMKILNEEIARHAAQCEPIGQLIEQLEKPESNALSSPQKYGPPIVVSLRKGPCRATNGKHSTVPVCLSAGIAQAVSLEDDLYDHYYGY